MIAPPEGVDPTNMESLAQHIHQFQPKHCIMPFLAHALGTLVGAFVAAKASASRHRALALGVGAFFLLGGLMLAAMLPAPVWFEAVDVLFAYLPMAWLGWKLSGRLT